MKRQTILAFIAAAILVILAWPRLLILLLVFPVAYYFINRSKKREELPHETFANIEEVEKKFGEPDDVVVLDASKANELSSLILFFKAKDVMVVAGEELKISDMVSVASKNLATPYTVDEWAVIITTKAPQHPTIYLRVGYDGGLARDIAAHISEVYERP